MRAAAPRLVLAVALGCALGTRSDERTWADDPPLAVSEALLTPGELSDADLVPPELFVALETLATGGLVPGPASVVVRATGLNVDWDGDGRVETSVRKGKSAVLRVPKGERRVALLVAQVGGEWRAAPAQLLTGSVGGSPVALLDADLDGRFDGPADRIRWRDGAFHRPAPERRLPVEAGLARWSLSADAGAWRLRLVPEALPAATRPLERRGLVAVNEFRNRTGLAPLTLDLAWCAGCQKHADYIRLNPVDGFGHSETEGRPGYSRAGLEAAIEGVMERTSDPASAVRRLTAMMMHRTPFLADPSVGVGVGAVGAGVESARDAPSDAPGYCVLRAGQALTSHAFPVLVPGPGQQDVPLLLREEIPIPDRHPETYAAPRGYPISVSYLDGKRRIQGFELRVKGRSEALPALVFTPWEPIHAQFAHNYATAFLLPDAPLEPRTTYEARCTLGEGTDAQVLVWRFTTARL